MNNSSLFEYIQFKKICIFLIFNINMARTTRRLQLLNYYIVINYNLYVIYMYLLYNIPIAFNFNFIIYSYFDINNF